MESKIRVLIADDQALFAHLLKTVLETRSTEFEVIGIACNGREALDLVSERKPDVLLLDVRAHDPEALALFAGLPVEGLRAEWINCGSWTVWAVRKPA